MGGRRAIPGAKLGARGRARTRRNLEQRRRRRARPAKGRGQRLSRKDGGGEGGRLLEPHAGEGWLQVGGATRPSRRVRHQRRAMWAGWPCLPPGSPPPARTWRGSICLGLRVGREAQRRTGSTTAGTMRGIRFPTHPGNHPPATPATAEVVQTSLNNCPEDVPGVVLISEIDDIRPDPAKQLLFRRRLQPHDQCAHDEPN